MRHAALRAIALAALAAALVAAPAACGRSPDEPPGALPARLALRSDTPLLRGRVVSKEVLPGGVRIRVQGPDVEPPQVDVAWITVREGALLLWPDGKEASTTDLRFGRWLTVWVDGPLLESYPVQAGASAILVER